MVLVQILWENPSKARQRFTTKISINSSICLSRASFSYVVVRLLFWTSEEGAQKKEWHLIKFLSVWRIDMNQHLRRRRTARRVCKPMMSLTQLSNCLTLGGSFSSVSTATIARKGAFCSIFWALQDLHSFAPLEPLRPEKISKFSSQTLQLFRNFQGKTSKFDNFGRKFRWHSTKFCRNFTDYTENAAKCRKSKETREKIRKKLDLSY